ncbi:pancreatic triacylglycerol lipase-like isoform X2 [Bacillus rossius redtenbacheri]|uniref:pancreatic triacylglycerol lipase-like isoform X2 n=1 Tax=Bacillus rossius redtenbacheri TaxID=93214 RepID=UPI002FDC7E4A
MRRARASSAVLNFALVSVCVTAAWCSPWATPAQEALDELHDAEILRAVVTSMAEYNQRRASHRHKRAESSVCYDDVGCFQASGPFSYLDMLPSSPAEVGTRFLVYSGRARSAAPLVDLPATNLTGVWAWAAGSFNGSAPTKVIVHGFGSSCSHVWVYEMRSALMAVEDCNVICVDWEGGAAVPNYVRAAANTRLVGKQVSLLLQGLQRHAGLSLQRVHLVGFSLGAHAAGFAGSQLRRISRITGLDPAGPLFESQDPRVRLDSSDAQFVDVIHSNGENLILGGLGSWQPMGHADFYPNGGRMQKGCSNLFVGAVTDIIWSASEVEGRSLCNHRRAYKFFTDSVSPRCHFPSFPCESYDHFLAGECFPCSSSRKCGNMGYYADRSQGRGTLFLITREEEPFCAHQYHLRLEHAPSEVPVVSYGRLQITLIGSNDINETFVLTAKDDEELKSGGSIMRMLVPHPILQEPTSLAILYTAYSGWISSGLPAWVVNKLSLTDSFGKSLSVCRKALVLESGVPIVLRLYPGECHPPPVVESGDKDSSTTTQTPSSTDDSHQIIRDQFPDFSRQMNASSRYRPTLVERVGDEPAAAAGNSSAAGAAAAADLVLLGMAGPLASELLGGLPWQPLDRTTSNRLDDGNGTDPEVPGSAHESRGLAEPPPGRRATTVKYSNVRTRHADGWSPDGGEGQTRPPREEEEALRLLLNATLDDEERRKSPDQRQDGADEAPRSTVVQFFSHRLASMLAQAERYARTAFVDAPSALWNYVTNTLRS